VTELRSGPIRATPAGIGPRPAPQRPPTSGPPPRPAVTSDLAPPGRPPRARVPGSLQLSVWSWFAAFGAGLYALTAAVADYSDWHRHLMLEARTDDPTAATELLWSGAELTILVAVASSCLLIAGSAVCLVPACRPGPIARWLLTATALVTLVAVVVDHSLAAVGPAGARIAFLAQGGLLVLALLTLFTRSSRTWFREPRG
jgi:hypothetical protein